ncbi:hypothetical protein CJF42_01440 [Pseudoalteromonas sp. NBT06-2]|uniref:EAL domain-containing protein n=1 Tax=Pseudoalteromonas sp. NBT06-2 TaxID=2025950 RepID=UPI000BA76564|nr:EAL domain-containing protein [Pseudoalteromonas sp. NBT06-2]PAJ76169.1 hypothetical protein CJF42_01440 [Pseudoalteromonas sp. NBT06-2]
MKSLQSRIFILFISLLLCVQMMSFFSTYQAKQKSETVQLNNKIETAKQVFETQFDNRNYYLSAFAETAAKDYGLKTVFSEDRKSFLLALNNHRKRISADLAIAIKPDGEISGQLITYMKNKQIKVKIGPEQGQQFSNLELFTQTQTAELYYLDSKIYQLSLAPLKSGSRVIGWIGFGYIINQDLANKLAKLTGVNVSFLLKDPDLPTSKKIINSNSINKITYESKFIHAINSGKNDNYIISHFKLGEIDKTSLTALLFQSKVSVLKKIHDDWQQFLIIFMLEIILSLFGAYLISASITRPIKQLIHQIKYIGLGKYDQDITINASQELTQLANEFNQMKDAVVAREQLIRHQAYHDSITNLPNRNYLVERLSKLQNKQQNFIILQLNIRRIKEINDTLGHQVGDKVIVEFSNRLKLFDCNDELFHLGADEFVLISQKQDIKKTISQLSISLDSLFNHENLNLHLQYSIGIAKYPEHNSENIADLLKKTDIALQYAKKHNRIYQIYDRQFDFNTLERLHLINSLKTAIEQSQLVLHYQPKVSLASMKISHVEALVRWEHPINGLIPPDSFISIAEQTGQMDALTRWVTKEAIRQYLAWQKRNINIKIAINISAENLKDKSYSDYVIALKNDNNIADNEITLEVTEDAVLSDPAKATEILTYLKSHGFKLSIDDYGTGYSSLAQLKQLPVQELKIDKSFVQHLMQNTDDQIIVRSTIELAHNMGLSVVAEGIEDERTLLWLKEHHCELAQGYFISRPIPAKLFQTWLKECTYTTAKEGK